MNSTIVDTTIFKKMTIKQLLEVQANLKEEKKKRNKMFIKPAEDQHIKPVKKRIVTPLKEKYIKPIDKILKELKTYLPDNGEKPAFFLINGQKFGPLTRKKFMSMIVEVEEQKL